MKVEQQRIKFVTIEELIMLLDNRGISTHYEINKRIKTVFSYPKDTLKALYQCNMHEVYYNIVNETNFTNRDAYEILKAISLFIRSVVPFCLHTNISFPDNGTARYGCLTCYFLHTIDREEMLAKIKQWVDASYISIEELAEIVVEKRLN